MSDGTHNPTNGPGPSAQEYIDGPPISYNILPTLVGMTRLEPHQFGPLIERMFDDAKDQRSDWEARQVTVDTQWSIDKLPEYDAPFALKVYTALAESSADKTREFAGSVIHLLPPHDKEGGLRLWDQLIRDPVSDVRDAAYEYLGEALRVPTDEELARSRKTRESDDTDRERRLVELSVTKEEALQLQEAYRAAEAGERLHDIGSAILNRLVELVQAARSEVEQ